VLSPTPRGHPESRTKDLCPGEVRRFGDALVLGIGTSNGWRGQHATDTKGVTHVSGTSVTYVGVLKNEDVHVQICPG
jgi:hypothetical protein